MRFRNPTSLTIVGVAACALLLPAGTTGGGAVLAAGASNAELIQVAHRRCRGGRVYSWRRKRCVCGGDNIWNGRRCVWRGYYDSRGRLLPGYRRGRNGAIIQDNGGGE